MHQCGWQHLNEENYKELTGLIDPDFLKQGLRAARLARVEYVDFTNSIMHFWVPTRHGGYDFYIRFLQWEEVGKDPDLKPMEKARLLIWSGDVQLHCTDPSFLFWGYAWILTQLDAALVPETHPPNIRNPQHRGITCKHGFRVLKAFPFHATDIARAIRDQFG